MKKANIQKIAQDGAKIYEKIKKEYEPEHIGDFLAIEIKDNKAYLGTSSSEAVEKARKDYPNTVFYVVKIGYSATETLARLAAKQK